ncbi:Golgi-associated plant pathogenesis-related protein 1-like [Mytilus californianus]|uniref:Golgi-associated plant pathogenesis-related protein 1-like n=1 Tax=Mytilus californianus TaxID=6549 RepID=UPI002246B373|nr:Golgi-associated plant pathogenesis-related protein 1-like [Mytilus californianus]
METFAGCTEIKKRDITFDGRPSEQEIMYKIASTQESLKPTLVNKAPDDFVIEAVDAHNALRQRHGLPPLKVSHDLCSISQKWADYLIDTNESGPSLNGLGENIAEKKGNSENLDYTGKAATQSWYREFLNYHCFRKEPPSSEERGDMQYGHFTQVIWKNTKEMGIGKAKRNGRVVVVANYRPSGNCIGSYAKNVFPARR